MRNKHYSQVSLRCQSDNPNVAVYLVLFCVENGYDSFHNLTLALNVFLDLIFSIEILHFILLFLQLRVNVLHTDVFDTL